MDPITTNVFDIYWRFAAERQAIFFRRQKDPVGPWTQDPILRKYRFTNLYRASDRVSQYLIASVQYRDDRPQSPHEIFFRTLLFKIFNRIETWEEIERSVGPIVWDRIDLNSIVRKLDDMLRDGKPIYSAAYIMPAPRLGRFRKHENHLALVARMMRERMPDRVAKARSLGAVYEMLLSYPGIGKFLAFQYSIDLNYSPIIDFDEGKFVVAGPGAIDGITKCFESTSRGTPEEVIFWTTERQEIEFAGRDLKFQDLFGRRLQPVDIQNIFCEVSKYARVSHPEVTGASGRTRIKQTYSPNSAPLAEPMYPPKWRLRLSRPLPFRCK